ncbi:hypothetical protein [Pseudogracilibacillus sp. SO30301A]|uniref:hypothetical protein n=1 Tax=Pseudogracilibacillus sp. SO30301A TaxID=3098291 RepID=UPI00300E0451
MLKIDESIRRKYIPSHVWTQLHPIHVKDVKTWILFLTFLLLDAICILPVVGNTFHKGFFLAIIIPVIFINGWAVTILVRNSYSTQMEMLYFVLANSVVLVLCMFLVAQKIVYIDAQIESSAFFIISVLFYIGWIIYFTQYIFKKYANMKWTYGQKNVLLELLRIIMLLLPSNGYNFYHFYVKGNPFEDYITSFIFLSLGILPIYLAVLFLHRILFILANPRLFRFYEPSKKEVKQAEAKGKKIKVG